jgi:hypothetical protein
VSLKYNFCSWINKKEICVNGLALLIPYAIMPICLLVVLIDVSFFNGYIQSVLPSTPDVWGFWTIIFALPHIVASIVTLADKEYVVFYKKHITTCMVGCFILAIGVPYFMGSVIAFLIMAFFTMYHVMMQQYGLGMMMLKLKMSASYNYWKISSILGAFLLFLLVYGRDRIPMDAMILIKQMANVLIVFALYYAFSIYKKIKDECNVKRTAFWYFLGNALMLPACYICYESGYPAFVIIIPRLIHDITAYMIYIAHDHNRNRDKVRNKVYVPFVALGMPVALLCIPISMGVSYVLMQYAGPACIMSIVFFHYFIEGYVWKKGALHRQYVKFV